MPRPPKSASKSQDSTANLGFEAKLWLTANKLRNNMDAAKVQNGGAEQCLHVVLGLICLHLGENSLYGQNKWVRRQHPFGLATRASRVRLQGQQAKQSNATTRRLAIMNLAIRSIEADIGKEHADTFRNVQHPDLRADYVLANPPINDSDWFSKDDDVCWQFGVREIWKN